MASLVASDASAVVVDAGFASPPRVAKVVGGDPTVALPARSATTVRIAGLAVLCAATLVAPALLLVWMPILLGVPHIASDIRYLVVPLPRRQLVLSVSACAMLVLLKAASLVVGVSLLRAEMVVVAIWLLAMLAMGATRRRSHALQRHARASGRSPAVWLVGAFATMIIIALPIQFAIVAAFAHNFVAIIAWLVVKRPARRHALAVIATIGAAVAVLLVAGPTVASLTGGASSPWLTIDKAAHVMFGGVPLQAARALMIAFAFLQAVHYAIWLDWIPRTESRQGSTVSRLPTQTWMVVLAGTLVVVAAALVNAAWARTTYLALATFHIYLELVVLGSGLAVPLRRPT